VITHIDDVARIHVEALDEERVKGNHTHILEGGKDGEKVVFEDVNRVARREFLETLERGWIKEEGNCRLHIRFVILVRRGRHSGS